MAEYQSADFVYIVLAVFEPSEEMLDAQINSLANQTHENFEVIAVIADTKSDQMAKRLLDAHKIDYHIILLSRKTNSVTSFEHGLNYIKNLPEDCGSKVCFCDQDDLWDPKKLEIQLRRLSKKGVSLVHSDARVIDVKGNLLYDSLFKFENRVRRSSFRHLLYRNNVTGMTAMFERSVLEYALPFPKQNDVFFHHDLWVALVATIAGKIDFIETPLVSYRQHATNAVGIVKKTKIRKPNLYHWLRQIFAELYLQKYLAISSQSRFGVKTDKARKNAATVYFRPYAIGLTHLLYSVSFFSTGKWAVGVVAFNSFVATFGVTLLSILKGTRIWLSSAKSSTESVRDSIDILGYGKSPGAFPPSVDSVSAAGVRFSSRKSKQLVDADEFMDSRMRLKFSPIASDHHGSRVRFNIMVPSCNPSEIYAGIATAFDIGRYIYQLGCDVRFIATDASIVSTASSEEYFHNGVTQSFSGNGSRPSVNFVQGTKAINVDFTKHDKIIATAWWTAHLAQLIIEKLPFDEKNFLYLIQDYEPNFYPWGADYANALASYLLNFDPLINTTLLADYFESEKLFQNRENLLIFSPSIDKRLFTSLAARRQNDTVIRIAVYGRPSVDRNLFGTLIATLAKFVTDNDIRPSRVEFISIGELHGDIALGNGNVLKSLGKLSWESYLDFLPTVDIGVALMLSPHPSHLPIEFALSGSLVLTNSFANKRLSELSPNILSVKPDVSSLSGGLAALYKRSLSGEIFGVEDINLSSLGIDIKELSSRIVESQNSSEM